MTETTRSVFDRWVNDDPVGPDTVAERLGVSIDWIGDAVKNGMPVYRLGSGSRAHRRFRRSEVLAWMQAEREEYGL